MPISKSNYKGTGTLSICQAPGKAYLYPLDQWPGIWQLSGFLALRQVQGFHAVTHLARKRLVLCNTLLSAVFPLNLKNTFRAFPH